MTAKLPAPLRVAPAMLAHLLLTALLGHEALHCLGTSLRYALGVAGPAGFAAWLRKAAARNRVRAGQRRADEMVPPRRAVIKRIPSPEA